MWIKTTAEFRGSISDMLWESMDDDERDAALERREFRFNTNELIAYNESRNGETTIRLRNGYEITVGMAMVELDEIFFSEIAKINS